MWFSPLQARKIHKNMLFCVRFTKTQKNRIFGQKERLFSEEEEALNMQEIPGTKVPGTKNHFGILRAYAVGRNRHGVMSSLIFVLSTVIQTV